MNSSSNKNRGDKYFYVTNFYLAAFLFVKDLELTNIDRADQKRSQFIFVDTPQREKLVEAFNFAREDDPTILVDARKLITSIKMLKDKLYSQF